MSATIPGILPPADDHASRPAATAVEAGSLYSCTDHALIYQSDGATWATWATLTGSGIPATLLDVKGDIIAASAADTAARLAAGTNDHVLIAASGETTGLKWGQPKGTLLNLTRYAGASTYSTSSATLADVDATNMAVTFTAPASGNVLVKLTALTDISVGSAGQFHVWGLRESTTDLGTAFCVDRAPQASGSSRTAVIYLTGVSAGSHTYKWSFAISQAVAATARILVNAGGAGSSPPAFMEVYAA